jgi:hypothetical protein
MEAMERIVMRGRDEGREKRYTKIKGGIPLEIGPKSIAAQ